MQGFLWCVGEGLCPSRGRPQGSPLRKRYKRCGEESPSHGFAVPTPFRQGGAGDGGTDCHSQCAHWLRNDREFYMGCGGCPGGRTGASAPTEMSEHLRRAACPHAAVMVRWLTGGGLRAARPTEAYFAVRRGGALPLPRATARVAPTKALHGARKSGRGRTPPLRRVTRGAVGGPMWASAPTGGTRGAMGGRPQGSPLRSVTRSAVGRVVREADPYGGVVRSAAQIKGGPAGRPYGFYIHFLYLISTFYMRFAENQSPRGRGLPV